MASESGGAQKPYIREWNILGRMTVEGESPVHEGYIWGNMSKAEPEKFCLNMPAPSGKAKYY